jgi:hypothetical protein
MKTIYHDLSIQMKVNGQIGGKVRVTNGVRQGCGISPLIFILVQEALLISIRDDAGPGAVSGIEVIRGMEVRERGMADDTVVYIKDMTQVKRLFRIIEKYEKASGQSLNASKTSAVLLGTEKQKAAESPLLQKHCKQFGVDQADAGLGIEVGTQHQINEQWRKDHTEFRQECEQK